MLEYYIRTDKAEHRHPTAFDIELDMDDWAVRTRQHNVLARFDANSTSSNEIAALDDRIAQAALTIRNRAAARQFAEHPQKHLQSWIASQARDLDALLGAQGAPGADGSIANFSAEEQRRASTYQGAWLDEAVVVTESQRLAERLQELQSNRPSNG